MIGDLCLLQPALVEASVTAVAVNPTGTGAAISTRAGFISGCGGQLS